MAHSSAHWIQATATCSSAADFLFFYLFLHNTRLELDLNYAKFEKWTGTGLGLGWDPGLNWARIVV
jgi:hypothetical protein